MKKKDGKGILKKGKWEFIGILLFVIFGRFFLTGVTGRVFTDSTKPPKCMLKFDVSVCYSTDTTTFHKTSCKHNDICRKHFFLSYVKLEPYSPDLVKDVLQMCCGECVNVTKQAVYQNISEIPPLDGNFSSHFIFPVLGRNSAKHLYGYYFIPLMEPPSLYYFTAKQDNLMIEVLGSCLGLWPLLIICFLLVAISGFVGWAFETRWNVHEFPRAFIIGWFEGCLLLVFYILCAYICI